MPLNYRSMGLSPRPRGSRPGTALPHPADGSIPAPAGKPSGRLPSLFPCKVYPRARGEAHRPSIRLEPIQGLSPRPRGSPCQSSYRSCRKWSIPAPAGSRQHGRAGRDHAGSIPAPAGKPSSALVPPWRVRVYPRARGEAFLEITVELAMRGLSPRPRGSRWLRA